MRDDNDAELPDWIKRKKCDAALGCDSPATHRLRISPRKSGYACEEHSQGFDNVEVSELPEEERYVSTCDDDHESR